PNVLDQVQVFSNVQSDTVDGVQDTVQVDNIDFIQNEDFFKPERLRPFVLLEPGQTYNPETSTYTSRRLSSIGTYKFVNIQYELIDSTTDHLGRRHLKSIIELSPLPKNSIQLN